MKVAVYVRVSTERQENDNQLIRLLEVVENRKYDLYKVYEDKISGGENSRPALDQLRKDAKAHRFDLLLALKIDRVARSTINFLMFLDFLDGCGVAIEFLDQPIETRTPAGRMVATFIGAVAEFERSLGSERTKDGLARTVKKGTKLGRKVKKLTPYQKDKIKSILAENPRISNRQLAEQFEGISRNTLIALAKAEGLIS